MADTSPVNSSKCDSSTQQEVQAILSREARRTEPDYITYVPRSWDNSTHDTHNEHFLVFEGPHEYLMAVWTQALAPKSGPGNRIVFSRSKDNGVTWEPPTHVAGPRTADDPEHMASWAFPMLSKTGRIYVIYNQHIGISGWIPMHTGLMNGVYSDDDGKTWSKPQNIPMPKSAYDDPEGKIPAEWIVWQTPMRDLSGGYIVGYSHWVNPERATKKDVVSWTQIESVVEFMRFENIDENPDPKHIRISNSAWGKDALRVPHYTNPILSIAQEPSLVRLPDRRLFCVMRTMFGCIWYSLSADDGVTWCSPRPLLRRDHGSPILEPLCCCPIYEFSEGRYILLHHNNDGRFQGCQPEDTSKNRRPAFVALGEFRPRAEQPIWFSESKQLMDNDGVGIGPLTRIDIGVYPSVTNRKGNFVLWHPDRKFFLLGKRITAEWLSDLEPPA